MIPQISVIIPIYNVEKYIERCARSLFEQTLQDIEFIFIDDCSPDNSVKILKDVLKHYPKRQEQTKIISLTQNGGSGNARTIGIKAALGEYIIHCDSDDWIDKDLYEKMYNSARTNNADIVICDIANEFNNHTTYKIYQKINQNPRIAIQEIWRNFFDMYTWNKLVKREILLLNSILPFPNINMWEDNGIMYRIFYHSNIVIQIHDTYYHYNRCNENALTHQYGEKRIQEMITCAELLTNYFTEDKALMKTLHMLQFCAKVNLITDNFKNLKRFKKIFPGVEREASKIDKRAFSKRGRIRLFFVTHHLTILFILIYKLKNFLLQINITK